MPNMMVFFFFISFFIEVCQSLVEPLLIRDNKLSFFLVFFLTFKAPIMTATDSIHKYFFIVSVKIILDISCESSARQKIHM